MAEKLIFSERVIVDSRRGSYEMRIRNLGELRHQDCIETNIFKIGTHAWKLLSCNPHPLTGDVCLTVVHKLTDKNIVSGYRSLNVKPYGFAGFAANVAYDTLLELSSGFIIDGELKLSVDIWNTRTNGLRTKRTPGVLINWEGLSRESIEDRLASGRRLGITSKTRRRSALAFSNERIRDFLRERPKYRYWLCGRTATGELELRRPLDALRSETVFGDISEQDTGDLDWVTVFKEKRTEAIEFPLPEHWIVIFCKRYDIEQQELWYLDHIFAQEMDLCEHLHSRMIHLAQVSHIAGDLYIETEESVKRIDDLTATLSESGVQSGSVVVIEVRPDRGGTPSDALRSIEQFYALDDEALRLGDETEVNHRLEEAPSHACVVCWDAERTAGFLHGASYLRTVSLCVRMCAFRVHKCVCMKCGEKIMKRQKPRCPICRQPAKQLITNVYSP